MASGAKNKSICPSHVSVDICKVNALNLDQSTFLLFGKELMHQPEDNFTSSVRSFIVNETLDQKISPVFITLRERLLI